MDDTPYVARGSLAFYFALLVHEALVPRTAVLTVASFMGGTSETPGWIEGLHRALHHDAATGGPPAGPPPKFLHEPYLCPTVPDMGATELSSVACQPEPRRPTTR